MRRVLGLTIAAFTLAAIGTPIAAAGTTSAAVRPLHCAMIVFTPNSGDGLFDITARSISCRAARSKLIAARGVPARLRGWRCRLVHRYEIGSARYVCRSRALVHGRIVERVIGFTTGN